MSDLDTKTVIFAYDKSANSVVGVRYVDVRSVFGVKILSGTDFAPVKSTSITVKYLVMRN